jgi:pilus assembly protein CpaB
MIRPQTVTLAAIAIMFGLITAWGAKQLLTPKPVVEKVVEAPHLPMIAVAQANLTPYTRITERDVLLMEAPSEAFLADSIPVTQRAVGRLVKTTILAGHPVRNGDLYEPGKVPQMADELPPGYRAVTVRVDDAIASNGAILTGSLVDVSLTFDSDHPEIDGTATMNLFRKLKVLAPNPNKEIKDTVFAGPSGKAILTLAATPEQANKLILAQQYGTVNVTLCSNMEKEGDALAGNRDLVSKTELLNLPPIPPPQLVAVPEPPIRKVVEIYHGADVQQIVFTENGELLSTEEATGAGVAPAAGQPAVAAGTGVKKQKECVSCKKGKKTVIHFSPSARPAPAPTPADQSGGAAPAAGNNTNQPTPAPTRATTPPPTPDVVP